MLAGSRLRIPVAAALASVTIVGVVSLAFRASDSGASHGLLPQARGEASPLAAAESPSASDAEKARRAAAAAAESYGSKSFADLSWSVTTRQDALQRSSGTKAQMGSDDADRKVLLIQVSGAFHAINDGAGKVADMRWLRVTVDYDTLEQLDIDVTANPLELDNP